MELQIPQITNHRKQSQLGGIENQISQTQNFIQLPAITEQPKHQKRNFNLKVGDIIYFKSYLSDEFKGVISGDGIASNKLECIQILSKNQQIDAISKKCIQQKVGSLTFQKSLFQIVTGRKYLYQNQYQKDSQIFEKHSQVINNMNESLYNQQEQKPFDYEAKLQELENKAEEERKENDRLYKHLYGSNLVYGQEIQLVHLYSDCILSLNSNILAKENCCRELSLEEKHNDYSNFRILSMNSVKNPGEPILYGDQIIVQNSQQQKWYIGIQKPSRKNLECDGLEVNASEEAQPLKISSYIDNKTEEEIKSQGVRGKYLQSGDVVTIKNRYLGGYLSVRRIHRITDGLDQNLLYIKDYETNIFKKINQFYFDVEKIRSQEKISQMFSLTVFKEDEYKDESLNCLWQIQHVQSLIFKQATYESLFLIRHVCTGLFLFVSGSNVGLTYDGLKPEAHFQLKSKKTSNDQISYNEACKIQSSSVDFYNSQDQQIVLVCLEDDKVCAQRKSQKQNIERTLFILKQAPSDISKTAFRLNSLQQYLISFYIFLQDWGITIQDEKRQYEYFEAFNNQKLLYDEILQLFQTLENLKMYLSNDGKAQSNEIQQQKQTALMKNDIINILFAILRLSNFMINGNNNQQNKVIQDKSPQKIAKQKLDPQINSSNKMNCIQEIYNILTLCVQSNVETSNYVLSLTMNQESILDFLLLQLKNQRKHVSNLIKESVRYTDMSNPRDSIKKWIDQISAITEENIEDQTLYIEILSLMMIDPYEKPNLSCQNSCRRLLFRKGLDQLSVFQKSLFELNISQDKNDILPIVNFFPKREKIQVQAQTYQFSQNNPVFCQLYNKFIEKQIKSQSRFVSQRPPLYLVSIDFFTTENLKANQLVKQEDMKNILPIFIKYENYLMTVMELYSSLCKGRNLNSINCLHKNCFLHQQFLDVCLQRQMKINNQLRFEKTLMDLYCNLYLDIDPLIKVSNFDNKCYLSDDLENFDIQKQSGFYFYENNASKSLKKDQEYTNFLTQKVAKVEHQQLKLYAIQMIQRENINNVRIHYLEMFTQTDYPDHLMVQEYNQNLNLFSSSKQQAQNKFDYQRLADFQLQYFLGMVSMVKNTIDLGYNKPDENRKIFTVLPNIFVALILIQQGQTPKFNENEGFEQNLLNLKNKVNSNGWVKVFLPNFDQYKQQLARKKTQNKEGEMSEKQRKQEQRESEIQFSKNWILYFLVWTSQYNTNELLITKIFLEAIQILKIFDFLQLNLQILHFLFNQQLQGESNSSSPSLKDIDEINSQGENSSQIEKKISKQKSQKVKAIKTIFKEPNGNKFTALLFTCLQLSEKRNKLNLELLQLLIEKFHQPINSIKEIKEVEIIDNKMELKYFSIINGNSNQVEILSPKEAELLVKRALKFIKITSKKSKKKRSQSFLDIKDYLIKILEQFEQFFKPNSQDAQYFRSFQNIVRNAGVHTIFLQFLIDPKFIENSADVVSFYKNLVKFFKYFTIDNETNTAIFADETYLFKIFDIIQIQQQDATNKFYVPIKITKLTVQLIASLPLNMHEKIIKNIFLRIQDIGQDLFRTQPFFSQAYTIKESDEEERQQSQKVNSEIDAIAISSLIQYLKILRSLTSSFDNPTSPLPINKHLILSSILKNDFLRVVLQPVNYYQQLLVPDLEIEEFDSNNDILHYHRIKLHSQLIKLITECCKYYRLGIQEMQRILLYEQLKTILLQQQCEYIVKGAYLQCLFELYINKVREGEFSNDTVESDEVRDILSRIIIPELDQKQICKYLEGLAKLQENDGKKCIQKELRENIIKQKRNYFEKRQAAEINIEKEDGILRDSSEFWTYIRKDGLMHFLVYTYDEMKDRTDIENPEGNNLSDEFAIIKQNVQRIKEIFNVLERDFRVKKEDLDLDDYRELIVSIEEIIPQRKITKFGQNFRIGFMTDKNQGKLIFDKYDTLKEDQTGEKKLQEQDNVQRIENPFRRNFKIYLIRAKVNIVQFCQFIDSKAVDKSSRTEKILKTCNVFKNYISKKDIDEIYNINVEDIKRQEKVTNKATESDDWVLFQVAMKEMFDRQKLNLLNQNQQVQIYQRQQEQLDHLKLDFEKAAGILIRSKFSIALGDKIKIVAEDILSSDAQIELLIYSLESLENKILDQQNLDKFLKKCQQIFFNYEVYLIKMCRVFLRLKRPTQDELDLLQEQAESEQIETIKTKKNNYAMYQQTMADAGLDILALDILNNTDDDSQKIEALSFLIHLLDYGNEIVQEKFYNILQDDQQIKQKFLVFIRAFFLINLDPRLKELEQSQNEDTIYTNLCLKVLEILQALCENVNVNFQKFLSCQYDDDSYQANINIVSEVAGLLADLLEKGHKLHDKLQRIFRQSLESLVEFSTGFEENKKEICKNSRLFTLLNQILQQENLQNFKCLQKENRNIRVLIEQRNNQDNEENDENHDDEQKREEKRIEIIRYSQYQTLQSFIKLLLLLTQGKPDLKILEFILQYVDIEQLINIARQIYQDRIKPKQRNIVLDNICDEQGYHQLCSNSVCHFGLRTDEDNLLIQTGFNIFIICLKLAEHLPDEKKLSLFKFEEEQEEQEDMFQLDDFGEEIEISETDKIKKQQSGEQKVFPMFTNQKYQDKNVDEQEIENLNNINEDNSNIKQILQLVEKDKTLVFTRNDRFFKFYRQYTGRIEIQNEQNEIEKVYFQKPFLCHFITPNVKQHLIFEINRETDEDRMQGLIEYSSFYKDQMVHYQRINNRMIMHFGAQYWRLLKDISFILCLIIVVLLIFMHDTVIRSKLGSDKEDAPQDNNITNGEYFVSYLNNIITIIQLILNLIIVFFCAIERFPISITYNRGQTNAKKVQILKKEAGFQIFWLTMKYYSIVGYFESEFSEEQVKKSKIKKLILVVFFDFDNFYNICIFGLTVYAFFNPYIYAVLLLDIIKRSEDLQNIIKSITSNGKNLIIFAFLGTIGLLIYAIIAFSNFDQMFDRGGGVYGYTFILAVTSTINLGLRNGGGLGDALTQYPDPYEDPSLFWGRYFFDFTFFIIFNILFIQIIFGIILDTFGELRDERQALVKEIEGKCFVCSLDKNDIDTKGKKGWHYHIFLEHSVYHMLYYIIYIQNKDPNDCNSLEKFVKKCILTKDTRFFPLKRALQIDETNIQEIDQS